MNDIELTTLAAKAACISPTGFSPLTDDGYALRLAVKLHLTLRCYSGNACAQSSAPGSPVAYADETNRADPYAATRRAIVRAAAEIGKAMP